MRRGRPRAGRRAHRRREGRVRARWRPGDGLRAARISSNDAGDGGHDGQDRLPEGEGQSCGDACESAEPRRRLRPSCPRAAAAVSASTSAHGPWRRGWSKGAARAASAVRSRSTSPSLWVSRTRSPERRSRSASRSRRRCRSGPISSDGANPAKAASRSATSAAARAARSSSSAHSIRRRSSRAWTCAAARSRAWTRRAAAAAAAAPSRALPRARRRRRARSSARPRRRRLSRSARARASGSVAAEFRPTTRDRCSFRGRPRAGLGVGRALTDDGLDRVAHTRRIGDAGQLGLGDMAEVEIDAPLDAPHRAHELVRVAAAVLARHVGARRGIDHRNPTAVEVPLQPEPAPARGDNVCGGGVASSIPRPEAVDPGGVVPSCGGRLRRGRRAPPRALREGCSCRPRSGRGRLSAPGRIGTRAPPGGRSRAGGLNSTRTEHLRMSVERPQARQRLAGERMVTSSIRATKRPRTERSRAIAWRSYAVRARSTTTSCLRSAPNSSESASRSMAHPGASSPSRIRRRQAPCSRDASAETSTSMSDDPAAPATDMVRST